MLTPFHPSNLDVFSTKFQPNLVDKSKEILNASFDNLPQEDPSNISTSLSPSISLQFLDDNNSFSEDVLSLPSTSASSSFDSLPSSSPQKSQTPKVCIDSIFWVDKRKKKRKAVLRVSYRRKLKTEICKLWAQYGVCKFGEECAFAHGFEEIREKIHTASNYKSRKCMQFHENGYCAYGPRCHFIHSLGEDVKKNPSLLEDFENIEIWLNQNNDCVCTQRVNDRRRLPCFKRFAVC